MSSLFQLLVLTSKHFQTTVVGHSNFTSDLHVLNFLLVS